MVLLLLRVGMRMLLRLLVDLRVVRFLHLLLMLLLLLLLTAAAVAADVAGCCCCC